MTFYEIAEKFIKSHYNAFCIMYVLIRIANHLLLFIPSVEVIDILLEIVEYLLGAFLGL